MSRNNRYAALAALGEMARGAGNFFGQVHLENVAAKRLAEARAEELQDIESNRAWQEDRDELQYARSQENSRLNADEQIRVAKAKADMKGEDGSERRTQLVQREDGVYVVDMDTGETILTNVPAEFKVADAKQTATQKTLEMRMTAMDEAVKNMLRLEKEGYDPTALGGLGDEVATGSKWTNWLASDSGQEYQSWASQAKEALLRTATGAAAPESENQNYIQMFIPRFGDSEQTKMAKYRAMNMHIKTMASAANADLPEDVALRAHRQSMEKALTSSGLMDNPDSDIPSLSPDNTPDAAVDNFLNSLFTQPS